jgi:calcineurin-like phosphoesterase family protein
MTETFYSSDHHHGHKNIIKFCPATRPYASLDEMTESLIKAHNSVVTKDDIWYFLGDFAFSLNDRQMREIFHAFNGKEKHLILGNHDHTATMSLPWTSVSGYKLQKFGSQKVVLCHYPIIAGQWDSAHHGSILAFGHVHGKPQYKGLNARAFDVGVDSIGPVPISYTDLKAKADKIPIEVSHH